MSILLGAGVQNDRHSGKKGGHSLQGCYGIIGIGHLQRRRSQGTRPHRLGHLGASGDHILPMKQGQDLLNSENCRGVSCGSFQFTLWRFLPISLLPLSGWNNQIHYRTRRSLLQNYHPPLGSETNQLWPKPGCL